MPFATRACTGCGNEPAFSRTQLENPSTLRCPRCGSGELVGDSMPAADAPPPRKPWQPRRRKAPSREFHRRCEDCQSETAFIPADFKNGSRPRCSRCGSTRLVKATAKAGDKVRRVQRKPIASHNVIGMVRALAASSSLEPPSAELRTHRITEQARQKYRAEAFELSNLLMDPAAWSPSGFRSIAHALFRRRKYAPQWPAKRRSECRNGLTSTGNKLLRFADRLERLGAIYPVDVGGVLRADELFAFDFAQGLRKLVARVNSLEMMLWGSSRRRRAPTKEMADSVP
jgi:DNA-directed RNA polymerase subunit RPC12/RpoP